MEKSIESYNQSRAEGDKNICEMLMKEIDLNLPEAESRIWHGHPVWFIEGNPIVGYRPLKDCVRLLFWSGRSFQEDELKPEGSFKAAEIRYTEIGQINRSDLKRWLEASRLIQWDYRNIVKRKGKLQMVCDRIATGVVHSVPSDLVEALRADKEALPLWEDITPLARNEWICWVEDARKGETRSRRIERVLSELKEGKRRPCCWPGCSHR